MLTDRERCLWMDLLCIAAENDGLIPSLTVVKRLLNTRIDHLSTGVKALCKARLIDELDDGFAPHDWAARQYISDSSTERVRKHRATKKQECNVSETPPDTETDTEAEKKESKGSKKSPIFVCPEGIDPEHWKDFLENRKKKKMASTVTAYNGVLNSLSREATGGWTKPALVKYAAEKGWGSIHKPDGEEPPNGKAYEPMPPDLEKRWLDLGGQRSRGEIDLKTYTEKTAPIFREAKRRSDAEKHPPERPPPAIQKLIRQATNRA